MLLINKCNCKFNYYNTRFYAINWGYQALDYALKRTKKAI